MAVVIKNYQVQLLEEDMLQLRERSGKENNKAALTEAVHHYLQCDGTANKTRADRKAQI